jgi:hypothetical protein
MLRVLTGLQRPGTKPLDTAVWSRKARIQIKPPDTAFRETALVPWQKDGSANSLSMSQEQETIRQIIEWGEKQDAVRAMVLTSSRAVPGAPVDVLSDYDVILILKDIRPFFESRAWLEDFGRVLALYRDPILLDDGLEKSGYVVQYDGILKIDFTLWSVEMMARVAATASR